MRGSSVAVIAGVSTVAFTQIATAAGMPPPLYNWTGPYIGIAAGYGWGHSVQTDPGISCGFFGTCSGAGGNTGTGGAGSHGGNGGGDAGGSTGSSAGSSGAGGDGGTGDAVVTVVITHGPIATILNGGAGIPVLTPGAGGDGSYSVAGGLLGATLGYNWQKRPWVVGLEGDYALANIAGSSSTCGAASPVPHACATRVDSVGTLRGRIGYAVGATDTWLPYVTGGVAVGELKASDSLLPASGGDVRVGWTVGAGLEVGLTQNWTARIEYLYLDLGNRQTFDVVPGVPENVSFTANIVRAGINYKFY
jgi:opacity protein-like surface antigen